MKLRVSILDLKPKEQTSPEVQKKGVSGPTKGTCAPYTFNKNTTQKLHSKQKTFHKSCTLWVTMNSAGYGIPSGIKNPMSIAESF